MSKKQISFIDAQNEFNKWEQDDKRIEYLKFKHTLSDEINSLITRIERLEQKSTETSDDEEIKQIEIRKLQDTLLKLQDVQYQLKNDMSNMCYCYWLYNDGKGREQQQIDWAYKYQDYINSKSYERHIKFAEIEFTIIAAIFSLPIIGLGLWASIAIFDGIPRFIITLLDIEALNNIYLYVSRYFWEPLGVFASNCMFICINQLSIGIWVTTMFIVYGLLEFIYFLTLSKKDKEYHKLFERDSEAKQIIMGTAFGWLATTGISHIVKRIKN